MHFVFVTSLVPVAGPKSGYDIANRVIADAMRLAGHRVSVIGFLQPGAEPHDADNTRLLGRMEVTNAHVGTLRKLHWVKNAFLNGEPVSVTKMHAASDADIHAALSGFMPFDGLVLNSVQLPGAFLDIFRQYPSAFIAHNVESRSAAENAANATNTVSRFLFKREARLLKILEADLCRTAKHVFALAQADRGLLGVDCPDRSSVLPLVTSVSPPPGPSRRTPVYDIGLIGSWTWAANRAGLDWFLGEVLPLLPADISIAIAGGMGADIPSVPANVELLGRVADARRFVRSCGVIPLISRAGTGVQLKTIETFEMGLPAVATASSLRGIASLPANCMAADDPHEFAAALRETVDRTRRGENLDVDGRIFHSIQLDGLVSALAYGLQRVAAHG